MRDPFGVVATAKRNASHGHYDQALTDYLWALDHGVEQDPAFRGARVSSLLDAMVELGAKFPPARVELRTRREQLAQGITQAAAQGNNVDEMTLVLFVRLGTKLGDESSVWSNISRREG